MQKIIKSFASINKLAAIMLITLITLNSCSDKEDNPTDGGDDNSVNGGKDYNRNYQPNPITFYPNSQGEITREEVNYRLEEYFGEDPFNNRQKEFTAKFGDGVTTIGEKAFQNCNSMILTSLPEELLRINDAAFYGCGKIRFISFPSKLNHIGNDAFSSCENLVVLVFPPEITQIRTRSFNYCTKLRSITFHSKIINIMSEAFANCGEIEKVVSLRNFPTQLGTNAFSVHYDKCILGVENEQLVTEYTASSWYNYFKTIKIIPKK